MSCSLATMNCEEVWTLLNIIFGSSLGASFYVLLRTHPYLVERTYDPKYNAAYVSRFITGVIGGVILAVGLGPFLAVKLGAEAGTTLTPGVLAILGGYAAEAVESILQRLVEILLAAVKGDGTAQAQAKASAEQAERAAKVQDLLPDLEAAQGDTVKFKATLQQVRVALKAK